MFCLELVYVRFMFHHFESTSSTFSNALRFCAYAIYSFNGSSLRNHFTVSRLPWNTAARTGAVIPLKPDRNLLMALVQS